jgi:uncharacterized protein YutE (UPF0331/DUF86 family)
MVDPRRVRRLLEALEGHRRRLVALERLDPEDYAAREAFAGRYLVQASAQLCIDLAGHVVSSNGWRPPGDYRDTFTVLEEHGVLEPTLAERLRDLVGLRNRLVHAALGAGVGDLGRFAQVIARLACEETG